MNQKKTITHVPAQAGFNIVELVDDGKAGEGLLTPVVAWEVWHGPGMDNEPYTVVYPVTVEGTNTSAPIVYPDGRVCVPLESVYDSVDQWVAAEKKKEEMRAL